MVRDVMALKSEEGVPEPRNATAPGTEKKNKKTNSLLESPGGDAARQHCDFSPVTPVSEF